MNRYRVERLTESGWGLVTTTPDYSDGADLVNTLCQFGLTREARLVDTHRDPATQDPVIFALTPGTRP